MAIVTVSLRIENRYTDLADPIWTTVDDAAVAAPDPADLAAWAFDHLWPYTGTRHHTGDAWYEVTVTGASDPTLIGRRFEFN